MARCFWDVFGGMIFWARIPQKVFGSLGLQLVPKWHYDIHTHPKKRSGASLGVLKPQQKTYLEHLRKYLKD